MRWCLCFTGSCTVELQLYLLNLTLLLGKNTLPFPAFGTLNLTFPPHRRAYTSLSKLCPNKIFPHQQDFFLIKSVTKLSTAKFSHKILVEKIKIFVQDFVPIRTALTAICLIERAADNLITLQAVIENA